MKNQNHFQPLKEEQQAPNIKWLEIQNDAKNQQEYDAYPNNLNAVDAQFEDKRFDKVYTALMSQQDLMDFKQIYTRHKSKWAHYTERFQEKNEAQLKNFFHNSLRRLSSQFIRVERANRIFQKSNVSPIFLHNAIDISLFSKTLTDDRSYIITTASDKILYCLYEKSNPDDDELLDTCKAVRTIHSFVKHMKIIKKFIQNEEVLRNVALFILKKEDDLRKKNRKLLAKETQQSLTLTLKQSQNYQPMENGDFNQIPEYAYYPENYMHYWPPMPPPMPYCYYPDACIPEQELLKVEVKKQQEGQIAILNKQANLPSSNEDSCKAEK